MVTFKDVVKRYGTTVAVDGLSLEIVRGEIFGLLGPNGAGKSTTVHLAVGLIAPDAGQVAVAGAGSPEQPAVRKRLGVAPQTLSLYELLTADENLQFFGKLYGLEGARLRERCNWALEFVGLKDRRRDRVRTYSGGMKRRLNLAAAVLHDPDVILLDEPTVGVDPQSRNLIFDNIETLQKQGRTIVYTTHYMEEAARLCDRVAIIDQGKLLAMDTVPKLIASHGGPSILIVETRDGEKRIDTHDPVSALNQVAAETTVTSFHVERATLEQVFLNLTGRKLRD